MCTHVWAHPSAHTHTHTQTCAPAHSFKPGKAKSLHSLHHQLIISPWDSYLSCNHPSVPDTIERKKNKIKGENGRKGFAIVTLLTSPSNYARVKAWVMRKMILMVNHLPYFVCIKKALVLTTFQSDSFPPTWKMYQEARLTKIEIKWLYYNEHLVCKHRDSLRVILNCMV